MASNGVEPNDFERWVELLGITTRAKHAYRHLVASGDVAIPAIRAGLRHDNADVRMHCAKALDRLVNEAAYPDLVSMLDDADPRVRRDTLHALACDRCKDIEYRPDKAIVLPRAIGLLGGDPSPHVRAMACEVVGRWVHSDEAAAAALVEAQNEDPAPAVRKKAAWYAPGGTIYEKSAPKT